MQQAIVIFDGECALCSESVKLILRNDGRQLFKFAPMQSAFATDLLGTLSESAPGKETLMLVEGNRLYTASTAALRIGRRLSGLWPALYTLIIIPEKVRDRIYYFIAKRRHVILGSKASCLIPDAVDEHRFLK